MQSLLMEYKPVVRPTGWGGSSWEKPWKRRSEPYVLPKYEVPENTKVKIFPLEENKALASFLCPACNETHSFELSEWGWDFNGDFDKPTFSPSLRYPDCHLFVKDGMIEFCNDCHHALNGLTVPVPTWKG